MEKQIIKNVKKLYTFMLSAILLTTLFPCNIISAEENKEEASRKTVSYNEVPADLNGSNWMSKLDDNIVISDLSIPGTHDSATYQIGLIDDSIACVQNHYIFSGSNLANYFFKISDASTVGQMDRGFRHFDLRIKLDKDKGLILGHGCEDSRYMVKDGEKEKQYTLSLDYLMRNIQLFLLKHPSETILIEISEENDTGSSKQAFEYFKRKAETENVIWCGDHVPTLGEVRGKIVIFSQLKNYQQRDYLLKDSNDYWATVISNEYGNDEPVSIQRKMVTDTFEVWGENHWDKVEIDEKMAFVVNSIKDKDNSAEAVKNRLAKQNKKVWVFNYSSANWPTRMTYVDENTPRYVFNPLEPKFYSEDIVPEIKKLLNGSYNNVFTGIIAFDFGEREEAEAVWKTNYRRTFTLPYRYNVTFDSRGGYEVDDQVLIESSKAKEVIPYKNSYPFLGWYEEGTDELFDFDKRIYKDTHLYAKWRWISVDYVDQYGNKQTKEKVIALEKDYRNNWNERILDSWIIVNESFETNTRIEVNGNINLIIPDGVTITANNGISIRRNSSLTIWTQSHSENNGVIIARINDNTYSNSATIGGNSQIIAGAITINGGRITAYASGYGAAIGSGRWTDAGSGTITINNGTVTAVSQGEGAAIGGGKGADGMNIVINNGIVSASANAAAAIGAGTDEYKTHPNHEAFVVTIHGGTVNAQGTYGIGGNKSFVTYESGTVKATGTADGAGIGGKDARISLSWTDMDNDSVTCSSYKGNIVLEKSFEYIDEDKNIVTAPITDNKTIVPGHDHVLRKVDRVAPTCEANGTEAYWICDGCGKMYSDPSGERQISAPQTINKLGHDWYEAYIKEEPTCNSEGIAYYMCRNGFHAKEVSIPRTEDHVYGEVTYIWNGTESLKAERTCTRCAHKQEEEATLEVLYNPDEPNCQMAVFKFVTGHFTNEDFKDQQKSEKVPKLPHSFGEPEYIWEEDNSKVFAKAKCQYEFCDHSITETVNTTAEETEENKIKYTAEFKNSVFRTQEKYVEKNQGEGHKHEWGKNTAYEWLVVDDPIFTTGLSIVICVASTECKVEDCNEKTSVGIQATLNTEDKDYQPAGCETSGVDVYKAEFNNGWASNQTYNLTTRPLGHNYSVPEYVWSNDNSSVTASMTCSHEGCNGATERVNTSSEISREASCTENSQTTYTADFTNEYFTKQTKTVENDDAHGHEYNQPEYTWDSENSIVTAHKSCKEHDDDVYEQSDTESSELEPATAEKNGKLKITASFTKEGFTTQEKEVTVDKLGHDYYFDRFTAEADETNGNITSAKAIFKDRMDPNNTREITAEAYVNEELSNDPTCTDGGNTVWTLYISADDSLDKTSHIAKEYRTFNHDCLGHDYGEAEYKWSNDNSSVIARTVCLNDDSHEIKETVSTEIVIQEGTGQGGKTKITYTAEFKDNHFAKQTKTVEVEKEVIHTVSFIVNDGSPIEVKVEHGHTVNDPINPEGKKDMLEGWFKDSANRTAENSWNFNEPVSSDLKLYAYMNLYVCIARTDSWELGDRGNASFRFILNELINDRKLDDNKLLEDFEQNGRKVYLDGRLLSAAEYDYEIGSLIINLHDSCLNSLSEGKHTLRVDFSKGSATTEFSVKKRKIYYHIPITGVN
ncbi:MAG: InlB B-repeat-containing protein [Erysipelotrichaceae bacterium]|nr:InlB B-repeat-containing protein [Erysipelotrichaceae bacterium]